MKFPEIYRFELRYQFRYFSTWLLLTLFLLFGFTILRMVTLPDGTHLNAPATIAFFTVMGSAIWVVIGGVVSGDAATRDIHTRMHPLMYTTPINKVSYLGARFLGALSVNTLLLLTLYAGFLLSFYGPGAKTQFLGPFRLASYLSNFIFIALPTVLATTAIQFTSAALSRRAIASYIASIVIIFFSQFAGTTVRFALEWKLVGGMMDLLGTSLISEIEGWTPVDKNTRLVALEGPWLWNRIVWFTVALSAFVYGYFRFDVGHHVTKTFSFSFIRHRQKQTKAEAEQQQSQFSNHKPETLGALIVPAFGFITNVRQTWAIAVTSFVTIAKSRGGLTFVAILAIGTGLFATEYMQWYGVPFIARTEEVLRILTPPLSSFKTQWIVIPLLTIFYAGELVWREREAGINELSDTTPVRESVIFIGKFIGLALIIITWMGFLMAAGIINQLVMDYQPESYLHEIDVYIKALFGLQLSNYLLFALLVLVVHVVINQKYIGHIAAFGIYGYILFASMIGIEHHLLIFAADPGWSYGDMSGFGPFVKPWLWFKSYWACWGFLLAVLAMLFWVRSKESGLSSRLSLAQHRFPKHKIAFLSAVALLLITGGFIFYNTNVLNHYTNKEDRMAMRAEYERRYGKYESATHPVLAGTKLRVEIYPDEQSAEMLVTYYLLNRSNKAIDSIHVSMVPNLAISKISFDRTSSPAIVDDNLGYHIYSLKEPIAPGDTAQMKFQIDIREHGFSNDGVDASVVSNGSHIDSNDWMPIIGFHGDRRLRDERDRGKYGLPARLARPSVYDIAARYDVRHAEPMNFEAIVGTAADQTAVAPGELKRTWKEADRNYFHFVTNAPISNQFAVFSARYAVRELKWTPEETTARRLQTDSVAESASVAQPVAIQIFHHPAHDENIGRMMKSVEASLAYYSNEFGPYPYTHFRVIERPGASRGMHAEAMTIDYASGYALMNPTQGGLDLPYHIMAHEVAHQWWGFHLAPAAVEGSGFLVESFATYSAMQVVEESLGYEHLMLYLSQMRQEYEVPRSHASPPLLRSNNRFMNYRKGPFALFALRNYIGKDSVNNAMRRMLANYSPAPPLPTTLDFYRELQSITPDSLQYLIHDLFAANTFWELRTIDANAKKTAENSWQVVIEVEAHKMTVDSIGIETNIPMNDWIEIGVYAPRPSVKSPAKVLYLQKHRIQSGRQKLVINVSELPARAGIDPNHLLIDLDMDDNAKKIKIEGVSESEPKPDLI
ncbi:MAG TPA: hypothetical protein VD927_08970 [Chryseosolibacter sp.]|nr:hypothetical protein [Chryseosolibacter sp.]